MKSGAETQALVGDLFRREAGRLVAQLARALGVRHLDLAEDVVQEALIAALRVWPFQGIPADPAAWLAQVARRKAIDRLRRDASLSARLDTLAAALPAAAPPAAADGAGSGPDDTLRMIFACCHPRLPLEARVALVLKTVCGFSVREIARAFLAKDDAIEQRLTRSKRKLVEERIELVDPFVECPEAEIAARIDAVGAAIYALFNEGYAAHAGAELVRADLAEEALRLMALLLEVPRAREPRLFALHSLLLLQAARLPARLGGAGELLTLAQQDRGRWDRARIAHGFHQLARAATGDSISRWHVEAAIASVHAQAPDFARTDWRAIARLYDQLVVIAPSPVVRLNRAIAIGHVAGPELGPAAGLRELAALQREGELATYHLLPAARGELLRMLGDLPSAAAAWREALALAPTEPERAHLVRLLQTHGFEP